MKKRTLRTTEILDSAALEAVVGQIETTISTGEQPEELHPKCCSGVHNVTLGTRTCSIATSYEPLG